MSKRIDLTGQRFGRWTVIEFSGNNHAGTWWKCRCDCGTERKVNGRRLRDGTSKSCGCLRKELLSTHGASKTRLYRIWTGMKGRCNNEHAECYKDYGGRGIAVCDEWTTDFTAFQEWALSHGYQDGLSIDRIDNSKGYGPDNCQWATVEEQNNNKRNNVIAEVDGVMNTIGQWSRLTGIPAHILYDRYHKGDRDRDLIRPLNMENKRKNISSGKHSARLSKAYW